ncbi:hypothetical protein [Konateibacter massiliensis]|uniref:hypothetical protein n=1 Tax=Konateibacter massiliensis TaxID=2002841 RepID=UPI000C154968|nr:hypothetical protein [Konateibacter massiliensis]
MLNYLNNNLMLINEYEELYKNGIYINTLLNKFKTEELVVNSGFEYGRFRVFIDSCLLLLNKEKLNHYYKNKYSFKGFFDEIGNDDELKDYIKFVKNERITSDISGEYLYYSLEKKTKTPWDQVATIRNAMAHMQYGHFMSQKSGLIIYYDLYNKDKGIHKDWGIVFEPVLHKFIQMFFSNYSYGILFKNTFFLKYSLEKKRKTRKFNFYEITCKNESIEMYNGYNTNLMREFAHISHDPEKVLTFLSRNKEKLNIIETDIKNIIDKRKYKKLVKRFKLNCKEEYFYGLKTLLDFETELSNFLAHIGQLNEVLYKYCIIRDSGNYTTTEVEYHKKQLTKMMLELKEDENGKFAFELGFIYLKAMNFALRTEDDDYIKIKYADVNVSMFNYVEEFFDKYCTDNNITESKLQNYIIERMRNALMHGHVEVSISRRGEVIFSFLDIYNKREEKIQISLDKLKKFLSQECLYNGVPQKTSILVAKPIEDARRNENSI